MRMRSFYMEGGHLRHNNIPSHDQGLFTPPSPTVAKRSKKYSGCRLPSGTKRMTEMANVSEWIKSAWFGNALTTDTEIEAYEICKSIMETYNPVIRATYRSTLESHSRSSEPETETTRGDLCANCSISLSDRSRTIRAEPSRSPQEVNDEREVEQTSLPNNSTDAAARIVDPNDASETQAAHAESGHGSEHDYTQKRKLERKIELALNDYNFLIVCSLFDEQPNIEFGMYSGVYLDQCRREKITATAFMKEVLTYSHWKKFGIVSRREHEEREQRLQSTMHTSEAIWAVHGKKSYQEMRWNFP